ncbi:MAG: hypothetical protein ABSB60_09905 [Terracidiphilus sp.]
MTVFKGRVENAANILDSSIASRRQRNQHIEVEFAQLARLNAAIRLDLSQC